MALSSPASPTAPSTGASAGNADLVTGGAATNGSQSKVAGTTSSDGITFQAPTGGSGSSTPSAALAHVAGSGASLSGSGLGPYTVSSLEDGDVVTVTCTHTDDGDGQVVKDVATVSVARLVGGWTTLEVGTHDATGNGSHTNLTIGGSGAAFTASWDTAFLSNNPAEYAFLAWDTGFTWADIEGGGLEIELYSLTNPGTADDHRYIGIGLAETTSVNSATKGARMGVGFDKFGAAGQDVARDISVNIAAEGETNIASEPKRVRLRIEVGSAAKVVQAQSVTFDASDVLIRRSQSSTVSTATGTDPVVVYIYFACGSASANASGGSYGFSARWRVTEAA